MAPTSSIANRDPWESVGTAIAEISLLGRELFRNRITSGAENSVTDSHHRCPLLNGDIQVFGHTHRDRVEIIAFLFQLIIGLPEHPKLAPLQRSGFSELGDRHYTSQLEARQIYDMRRQFGDFLGRDAAFAVFPAYIYLQAYLERRQ